MCSYDQLAERIIIIIIIIIIRPLKFRVRPVSSASMHDKQDYPFPFAGEFWELHPVA